MATYTKSGSFGWAGGGKDGAIVDMWATSRFAGVPAEDSAPPPGVPDAGPVTTSETFGNPGAFYITGVPNAVDYYIRIQYGGHTYWGSCPQGSLGGLAGGGSLYVLTAGGSIITSGPVNPGLTIQFAPNASQTQNTGFYVEDPFGNPIFAVGGNGGAKVFGDRLGASPVVLSDYMSLDGTTTPATINLPTSSIPGRGLGSHIWSWPGTPATGWVAGTTAVNDLWWDTSTRQMFVCVVSGGGTTAGSWVLWNNNTVITTNAVSGVGYTLQLSDANTTQLVSTGAPSTIDVPLNATVPFPVGTIVLFTQTGLGKTTVTANAGVTINWSGGFSNAATGTRVQWSTIGLMQQATDSWVLTGDAA